MSSPITYFGYIRKSTDDGSRQQLTIDAQRHEISAFAKARGLTLAHIFEERRSAKLPGRPEFRAMIEGIKRGKARGIIAWHPDRLSRNSLDGGEIIYLIDTGELQDVKFPQYWYENSPQGKYMLYQAFANSKLEIDTISARVKAAYREKARRGEFPTKPPPGYRNDRTTKGIVPVMPDAGFIVRTFEMCASGEYTVPRIREELTREGFLTKHCKPLSLSKYHFILNHPIYYGPFRYGGEWYEGSHEPLITKSLFDAAQKHLKRQDRKWSPEFQPFIYRSSIYCGECRAMITYEVKKGHGYLRCTKKRGPCLQGYLREEAARRQFQAILEQIALPKESLAILEELNAQRKADQEAQSQSERQTLEAALREHEMLRQRLLELLLNRAISEEEFGETKKRMILETAQLREKLAQLDAPRTARLEPVDTLLSRLSEAVKLKQKEDEREILQFLKTLGSNFHLQDRAVGVRWEKPFGVAAEWKQRVFAHGENPTREDTNRLWLDLLSTVLQDGKRPTLKTDDPMPIATTEEFLTELATVGLGRI